jgi:hypothetical protein
MKEVFKDLCLKCDNKKNWQGCQYMKSILPVYNHKTRNYETIVECVKPDNIEYDNAGHFRNKYSDVN